MKFKSLFDHEVCFVDGSGTKEKISPKLKRTRHQQKARKLGINQNSKLNHESSKKLVSIIRKLVAKPHIMAGRILLKIVAILLKRSIMFGISFFYF
tara:strand:- start:133 stop:420 length:288 start_codon:yes stop_codon:yes gene_type:complete